MRPAPLVLLTKKSSVLERRAGRNVVSNNKCSEKIYWMSSGRQNLRHKVNHHYSSLDDEKQRALQKLLAKHSNEREVPPKTISIPISSASNNADLTNKRDAVPLTGTEASSEEFVSPWQLTYTGGNTIPITSNMKIVTPQDDVPQGIWPIFRVMDEDGSFRDGWSDGYRPHGLHNSVAKPQEGPNLRLKANHKLDNLREKLKKETPLLSEVVNHSKLLMPSEREYQDINSQDTLLRAFTLAIRLREMDKILQDVQRQGRISFYMTCHGEEAIHIGAAAALESQDTILAQYREAGLLMWRGFSLTQFTDQCFGNKNDLGKGRQMPVHYGSRALNYQTISSPLGTQIPQAAGAGYRLKIEKKNAVAVCFFGDGCASTSDFHSGLNFAATLNAPVIFFCRNNGFAISTPVTDQYAGDGIISRASGYGVAATRVDGNDIFAVHEAVRRARSYALENSSPVLIEAMTFRQGHHSTSDDSFRYRSATEVQTFAENHDPIVRFQNFMLRHEMLNADDFAAIERREKIAVIKAVKEAEEKPKPILENMFTDVYHEIPNSLKGQQSQLQEHLQKYPAKIHY